MIRYILVVLLLFAFSDLYAETGSAPEQPSDSKVSTEPSELFKTNFDNYVQRAMKPGEVSELADKAMSMIDDMKNWYLTGKLKTQNINLKYFDGKDFPNPDEHQNNSETDQKIVQFTIACHAMYRAITKELISKIVEKSPLEMVSIIRELSVFCQFLSANPTDFGHGTFSEKHDGSVTVFATNDAILRIMKVLVYRNLLRNTMVYKMSRLASYFYNNNGKKVSAEDINSYISSLKRSVADDSRISIYIPGSTLDLQNESGVSGNFQTVSKNYINELNLSRQSKDPADKQAHINKAVEFAKTLLGVISDVKVETSAKTSEFCKILEQKREDLAKSAESDNEKISLKAKRDISNYKQIENFLICESILLDSLYSNPQLISLIMEKIPDFVPSIGQEITAFLRVLELVVSSSDNLDRTISMMREFAKQSEDGSYLLSPLTSVAMKQVQDLNIRKILTETDFSKLELCEYLKVK